MKCLSCRIFAALLCIILLGGQADAAPLGKTYFAGFAFSSDYSQIATAYPISSGLISEKDSAQVPLLERELGRRLAASPQKEKLIIGELGDTHSGQAVALAFVLDWENVATEKIGAITKIVVDVHAEILAFDFETKKVISAFPVAVQVRDAINGEVTQQHVQSLVRHIYYGTGPDSIFDRFVERLDRITIKSAYGKRLRVTDVVLEDQARQFLADQKVDQAKFKSFVGLSFSKFLSSNQNLALLPYSTGHAIGNKMAATFANGDVYQLEIPETDYAIHLTVRGFKKVQLDSNAVESAWGYGVFTHIKVDEPFGGKTFLDVPVKFAAVKKVPLTEQQADDWASFQDSTLSLFDQFTKQIHDGDSAWLSKWSSGDSVRPQMTALDHVLEMCR